MPRSAPHKKRQTVLPNGVRVTFEGHWTAPESEQKAEIHLKPKHSPDPRTQSSGTQAQPKK
jgi:hypothetical protein